MYGSACLMRGRELDRSDSRIGLELKPRNSERRRRRGDGWLFLPRGHKTNRADGLTFKLDFYDFKSDLQIERRVGVWQGAKRIVTDS
jgi:hypothetical protein